MKLFAQLFLELDQTTSINEKVEALVRYFQLANAQDKLWAIALFSHRRPKRPVNSTQLRSWASEYAGIPLWIFEESYHVVGDLAETIALTLPPASTPHAAGESLAYWLNALGEMKTLQDTEKKNRIVEAWQQMDYNERFVFNKFITGGFRVGVSQQILTKALTQLTCRQESDIAHRLMGDWSPTTTTFETLLFPDDGKELSSKPYPFYLAYALEGNIEDLGDPALWSAERKWDGIRGQLIVRKQEIFLWSRGEELITDKFPELEVLRQLLPDGTVIDGEVLAFKASPLPFQALQTRIGRKNIHKKDLEKAPVVLMCYDLLEKAGEDIRQEPFMVRRDFLKKLLLDTKMDTVLKYSEGLRFQSWKELAALRDQSREFHSEGLMLKRLDSIYRTGRRKGDWWKWKVDPFTIDAVMIYAQAGHGRRSNLYTDFTFAVWNDGKLVPFAKAYSGLTDQEFIEISHWVRNNTLQKFGPVRSVPATFVFEIAFEGIQASSRHKSGIALRFPRIHRWRRDKTAEEANSLEDLKKLQEMYH